MIDASEQQCALGWLNLVTLALVPFLVTLYKVKGVVSAAATAAQGVGYRGCEDMNAAAAQAVSIPAVLQERARMEMQTAADNLMRGLVTAIDTLQGVVVWVIGLYKSTFRCLLGLAVNGVLAVVSKIAGPMQDTAEHILQGGANVIQQLVGNDQPPVHVSLGNWTGGMDAVQQKVQQWTSADNDPLDVLVRAPFDKIKDEIHAGLGQWQPPGHNYSTAASVLQQGVAWCDAAPLVDVLDSAKDKLHAVIHVFIASTALVLVAALVLNTLHLYHRSRYLAQWRRQLAHDLTYTRCRNEKSQREQQHATEQELALFGDAHQHPAGTLVDSQSHVARWIRRATIHRYALYCLLMGSTGVAAAYLLQHILVGRVLGALAPGFDAAAKAWTADAAGSTTSGALMQLDAQLEQINGWVAHAEADLNEHAFGVVRSVAGAANETLGVVTRDVSDFVRTALGGTVLEQPAQDVLDCIMLVKLERIQRGISYIVHHAHVNLTRYEAAHIRATIQQSLQNMQSASLDDMWQSLGRAVTDTIHADLTLYWAALGLWLLALLSILLLAIVRRLRNKRT